MIYMTMIASMLLLIYKKKVKRFGIQNRQKTYCNGNSGYDYPTFCWRNPDKVLKLNIKNGKIFFRP